MSLDRTYNSMPDALVLDLSHGSLSVIRSLGRRGIRVYGFSPGHGGIGQYSKFCTMLKWSDCRAYDEKLVRRLSQFGRTNGNPIVLYCLSDEAVEFVDKNRNILNEHYLFQLAESSLITQILSKTRLAELIQSVTINAPQFYILSTSNIDKLAHKFRYPMILKLARQKSWKFNPRLSKEYFKLKVIENESNLRHWFTRLRQYDEILAQDLIPGSAENLFYATIYQSDLPGDSIIFIGQKLRVAAKGYGSETFYKSVENEEIKSMCLAFLRKTGYVGFAGIDFKYDNRDSKYKLIEINARLGLSDGIAVQCGLDLPFFNYQDLTGGRYIISPKYTLNKTWVWLIADMENHIRDHGPLSFFTWLRSIAICRKCFLVFDITDVKPFLNECRQYLGKMLAYARRRIRALYDLSDFLKAAISSRKGFRKPPPK